MRTGPGEGPREKTLLLELKSCWREELGCNRGQTKLQTWAFLGSPWLWSRTSSKWIAGFLPCCMHRNIFPASFLKIMSNNLRSLYALEEPMSRTNSSVFSLKVTCESPHNTQWSFANHTALSPCSAPSPSLSVWERPQFIPTVYREISSEAILIYRGTRHHHKAWELVFDGNTIT